MNRRYMVVYERQAEDNWGGWAQDIGGAVGAGETLEAARASLREGITIQLEYLLEQGIAPPAAISMSVDFSEFDTDLAASHYEIEWMDVDLAPYLATTDKSTTQAA